MEAARPTCKPAACTLAPRYGPRHAAPPSPPGSRCRCRQVPSDRPGTVGREALERRTAVASSGAAGGWGHVGAGLAAARSGWGQVDGVGRPPDDHHPP